MESLTAGLVDRWIFLVYGSAVCVGHSLLFAALSILCNLCRVLCVLVVGPCQAVAGALEHDCASGGCSLCCYCDWLYVVLGRRVHFHLYASRLTYRCLHLDGA